MVKSLDTLPPLSDEKCPPRHRRWPWGLALVIPLAVSAFTQLEFIQNVDGYLIEGMPWDVGKLDVLADIFAPAWALSLIVLSALNRRLLDRFKPDPAFSPTSRLGRRFGTTFWIRRSTWIATGAALLLVGLAYTREWERFGERPDAFSYVSLLLATAALCALPLWWVRLDVERSVRDRIQESKTAAAVDRYLFAGDHVHHARWAQLIALAGITAVAAWLALGQMDALLQGMHLTDQASFGAGSLSNVFQLDLSRKPAQVAEIVATWTAYSAGLGPRFASARDVLGQYLLIDTFVLIPSYVLLIGVLLLRARKATPPDLSGRPRRSYELLIAAGLSTLAIVATADFVENLLTWVTVDRIWAGEPVANWSVRLMWTGSLVRTVGFVLLAAGGVVLLALRRQRVGGILQSLVAVRGELLVLVILTLAFTGMPQTADVVRRWTVSVALITVVSATALAMLLQWTSSCTLHGLQRAADRVASGDALGPAAVGLPWTDKPIPLRRLVTVGLIVGFAVQVFFTFALGIPVGLRLGIPVALVGVLWLFGVPLPASTFERGDRPITEEARRRLPRLLGAAVFVVVGATVIRSSIGQLVFARHADWWLLLVLLPVGVGLYRLHSKTARTMGRLEALIVLGIGAAGTWLVITAGNPELSPAALTWAGVMILYGAMPFYYSYDPATAPSAFTRTRLPAVRVRPILSTAVGLAALTALGLVLFPLELAPVVGTVAVVLLSAMLFATVAAALVGFAEWTRPPNILAAFRFRRTPVFVLLAFWLVLAGSSHNDISIITGTAQGAEPGITIDHVWERWRMRNPGAELAVTKSEERPAVPMLFVASSGGGLRAAAWTGYVMDCVFGPGQAADCETTGARNPRSILAMSGVSGGSIGLASFAGASTGAAGEEDDWVKARLGDDYLAPTIAWLAFIDTPRTFLGFGSGIGDRAAVMERALERSWPSPEGEGFLAGGVFELWHDEPQLPVMIFNGTSVTSPCRFNASVIDANVHAPGDACTSLLAFEGSTTGVHESAMLAATQDLVDYLCPGQDVKLSTAALLGARFPVISSSGRVGGRLADCEEGPRDAYVVDGGYLEGSGAGTVMELWDHLEHRISAWNEDSVGVP